jgi:hypothetical protein
VTKEWRALVRVKQEEHSLFDYRAVTLFYAPGDSDTADSYDMSLQGPTGSPHLALASFPEYGQALGQAGSTARFLRLPLLDNTTDHQAVIPFERVGLSLPERLAGDDVRPFEKVQRPPSLSSEVQIQGRSVRISIANRPPSRPGLLALVVPVALLSFFGPRLLRFFDDTGTPAPVQVCASAFVLLFFVALPLMELVNASLCARRGGTVLTASPEGISIEQRGAWRTHARSIAAADILGIDYSTPESVIRSAERSAAQQALPAARGPEDAWWEGRDADFPTSPRRWHGRWVKGKGLAIKTRQGLIEVGAGLPGPEAHYLWAVVLRALIGRG